MNIEAYTFSTPERFGSLSIRILNSSLEVMQETCAGTDRRAAAEFGQADTLHETNHPLWEGAGPEREPQTPQCP